MRSVGRWIQSFVYSGMFCTLVLSPLWIVLVASGVFLVSLPLFAFAVTALAVLWFKPRVDGLHDVDAILKRECPSARVVLWGRGSLSWHFLGVFVSMAAATAILGLGLILLSLDSRELVVALTGLALLVLSGGVIWLTRRANRSPSLMALSGYVKSRGHLYMKCQAAADSEA